MNNFCIIYDKEGKEYSSVYEEEENNEIFENAKLEDFEIIKCLGEGAFGKVYKVNFIKNNRIYAMKQIDLTQKKGALKYNLNEVKFLEKLSHPHIVKYYKSFNCNVKEKDILCIILEYINNGSLNDLIKSYKKINMKIPEELIWNFLLQCYSGLTYIHQKGVVHRDIKPENLLLDDNLIVKIGDFGTSGLYRNLQIFEKYEEMKIHKTYIGTLGFMAPEVEKEIKYDEKLDIFSMGVSFYQICYFIRPDEILKQYDKEKANYSQELFNLIVLMLERDMNKRKGSKEIFEMIKEEYSKKYVKNTSIDALIRCLFSFEALTENFLSMKNVNENQPITKAYIRCLKAVRDIDKKVWVKSINNIRQLLGQEYTKLEGNKEIEPKFIFAFLIKYLHKELNQPIIYDKQNANNPNNQNILNNENNSNELIGQYNINCQNKHYIFREFSEISKLDMLNKFLKNFLAKVNSNISNSFMGLMKEIKLCNKCKLKTYLFKSYFLVTFDLEKILKNNPNIQKISLEENFDSHNKETKIKEILCKKCQKYTTHNIYNFFYSTPNMLIISIKRGVLYQYKIPVIINHELDISNYVEFKYLPTKYSLVGILKRDIKNGNEYYFSNIYVDEIWFRCEGKKIKQIEIPSSDDKDGEIIMLFYQAI